MNFRCLALVALTVVGGVRGGHANAQTGKKITTQDQFWVAYINTLKFSERWSLGTVQERRSIDPDDLDLVQQRPTGNFYFHRHNIRLTVVHKLDLSRKEPVKGAP
jgi:hypothetical protein